MKDVSAGNGKNGTGTGRKDVLCVAVSYPEAMIVPRVVRRHFFRSKRIQTCHGIAMEGPAIVARFSNPLGGPEVKIPKQFFELRYLLYDRRLCFRTVWLLKLALGGRKRSTSGRHWARPLSGPTTSKIDHLYGMLGVYFLTSDGDG